MLINPRHALEGLYPFAKHHPYDTYSMVDFDDVDVQQWPHFSTVSQTAAPISTESTSSAGDGQLLRSGSWRCVAHPSVLVCTHSHFGRAFCMGCIPHDALGFENSITRLHSLASTAPKK